MEDINIEKIESILKQVRDLKLKAIDLERRSDLIRSEASRLREKVVPYLYVEHVEYLFYKYGELVYIRDRFIAINENKKTNKRRGG